MRHPCPGRGHGVGEDHRRRTGDRVALGRRLSALGQTPLVDCAPLPFTSPKGGAMSGSYRDLRVWQEAMNLAEAVYAATAAFPKNELYGIVSQMQRAAVSVPSNI